MNWDVEDILDALEIDQRVQREDWVDCICPLHEERKPSFSINRESGQWICRHTNEGGYSALSLVQKVLKLNYSEAKRWVQTHGSVRRVDTNTLFNQVMGIKAPEDNMDLKLWFETWYKADPKIMAEVWFERGFTEETMRKFEVRYAPEWRAILWPVRDEKKVATGYTARSLRGGDGPKYLYPRGFTRTLFPLNHYVGESVILVEGPLDAMWLHQNGYPQALAVLGPGLTQNQVKWLRANTRRVFLCFDNDNVGREGAKQARERLAKLSVEIVRIPRVKDVQELSALELEKLLPRCI
jgi:DNA primase